MKIQENRRVNTKQNETAINTTKHQNPMEKREYPEDKCENEKEQIVSNNSSKAE